MFDKGYDNLNILRKYYFLEFYLTIRKYIIVNKLFKKWTRRISILAPECEK